MIIRISILLGFVLLIVIFLLTGQRDNNKIAYSQAPTPTSENLFAEPQIIDDNHNVPMVFVPSGTFVMGFTNEEQFELCKSLRPDDVNYPCPKEVRDVLVPTPVSVENFYLDQFEVSLEAYLECVQADVCITDPSPNQPPEPTNLPIRLVNYYDAAVYCAWRGGRLPTEAEWEYAARGPQGLVFPWGNEFDGNRVNFCDANCEFSDFADHLWNDGYRGTAPVDSFEGGQSWVGAYQMAGNLAEWTSTRIDDMDNSLVDFRVVKGGAYMVNAHQTAGWTRTLAQAEFGQDAFGFRCARTTDPLP